MADKNIFAITGFGGGISIGIQGDTATEFEETAIEVYGPEVGPAVVKAAFAQLASQLGVNVNGNALQAAHQAITGTLGAQPVADTPNNVVPFQPLPQPGFQQQTQAAPAAAGGFVALNIPFADKDKSKAIDGRIRWDKDLKAWKAPADSPLLNLYPRA